MITLAEDKAAQEIIRIGRAAYDRNLVSGRAGNLSTRLSGNRFMITGQGAPLGFLSRDELVIADFNGTKKRGRVNLSFETGLHAALYKNIPTGAVVHVHAPFTLTLAESAQALNPLTFEAIIFLGRVPVIPQQAPNVTDIAAVVTALALNNIAILKNHGVVSIGETIWDAFFLAELLEETAQMNIFSSLLGKSARTRREASLPSRKRKKPVRLFSKEHFSLLQQVINRDHILQKLGIKNSISVSIKQADTGRVQMLVFNNGKFAEIKVGEKAGSFIISGTHAAWRSIFNGLMDPFSAIIQKKILLEGSFRDLLQWYPFFRQLFNLWQTIPVTD
jgi:ribulose-5-phosphate 4-epimerase/fuculose-1-phosphate aldolase